MEVYSKAILFFVDGDDVLGKFFKAENSFVLLPINLEAAVGKDEHCLMKLLIFPKSFLFVKILPTNHLSQLIDSFVISQDLKYIGLLTFFYPVLFLEHYLASILTLLYTRLHYFAIESQGANGCVCSILDQLFHGLCIFGDGGDHEGSKAEHVAVVDANIHILVAFVSHKAAHLLEMLANILMKAVHAGVKRGGYAKDPQFEVIEHSLKIERSEEYLVPNQLNDLPDCRTVDQVVRLRKEDLEEQYKVLFIFYEDSRRDFFVIGEFGDEQFQSLYDIEVLVKCFGIASFSKPKVIGGEELLYLMGGDKFPREHVFVFLFYCVFYAPQCLQKLFYLQCVFLLSMHSTHTLVIVVHVRRASLDFLCFVVFWGLLAILTRFLF